MRQAHTDEADPYKEGTKMTMRYSTAKAILTRLYALPQGHTWEDMKAIYNDYPQTEPKGTFSPWYNKFTSHLQFHQLKSAPIGFRDVLYFDRYGIRKPNIQTPVVSTWVGKRIGEVIGLAFFQGRGFAPAKKVSITFKFRGMVFRGICAHENQQSFNVRRVA